MKPFKIITATTLFIVCLLSQTSCLIVHETDNGTHKGWYKNTNNPHNPNTTNPGKAKGHNKK